MLYYASKEWAAIMALMEAVIIQHFLVDVDVEMNGMM